MQADQHRFRARPGREAPTASGMPRNGNAGGHGLIGMQERAALFGGEVDAGSWAQGFRVKANLRTGDGFLNLARTVGR